MGFFFWVLEWGKKSGSFCCWALQVGLVAHSMDKGSFFFFAPKRREKFYFFFCVYKKKGKTTCWVLIYGGKWKKGGWKKKKSVLWEPRFSIWLGCVFYGGWNERRVVYMHSRLWSTGSRFLHDFFFFWVSVYPDTLSSPMWVKEKYFYFCSVLFIDF